MFDNGVTQLYPGLNNLRDTQMWSDIPIPDWNVVHDRTEDFDAYESGDWTVTKVGTGTVALTAGDGGILQLVTTAGASDSDAVQDTPAAWQLASGFRAWGLFRFSVESVLPKFLLGLYNVTTTPWTGGQITDGIWLSTSGTSAISVNIAVGGVTTTQSTGLPTISSTGLSNQIVFSWYYDGGIYTVAGGRVVYELTGAALSGNYRGEFSAVANFPGSTLLTPSFGLQNTTAVARTLNVDTVRLTKDRVNPLATPVF